MQDFADDIQIIISAQDKFTADMISIEKKARDTKKKLDKDMVLSLKANVAALDIALKDARKKIKTATTTDAKFKATLDTQNLQRQLTEAKRQLNNYLNTGDEKTSRLQAKFNDLGGTIKDVFSGGATALDSFLGKIPKIGGYLQIALAVVLAFGKALKEAGKNAQEFEDAFAGVRKTVDDSEYNLQKLEKGLIAMSKEIPMTVKELGGITELGGQLGVANNNLLKFTETVAKLSVSTNLTSEAAATDFARIANITQEPLSNIDRMGSSVVALGNNFATTESEIINFSNNIAGAGKIAGLATDQIFAIGAAFSSVGIQAEAGGTATQKVLLAINNAVNKGGKELEAYSRIAGQSAEEFKNSWKNDAGQGFLLFVKGLQKSGQDANLILEEMGLKDIRLQKAFLSLANAGDLLNNALETSNKAWEENNALQEEANKRFQTTTSQIQIQKNKWQAFSAEFGKVWNAIWVPIFGAFTNFFTSTLPTLSDNVGIFFENIFQGLLNLGKNVRKAFNNIPAAFNAGVNKSLGVLENFLNKGGDGINWIIRQIKKIPGVSDLIGDFNVGKIELGKIEGPEVNFSPLTEGMKKFKSFKEASSESYEIAAGKVKEGIKKEIETEVSMLEDIQKIFEGSKKSSTASRTDFLKKELEKQRDIEINAVQESTATEEEKMKKLEEIKKKYDKKKKEIEGKTNDELLKEAEEYIKKLKNKREDDIKDHSKKTTEAMEDIKKYTKKLDDVKKKFEEIKDKAKDTLRGIKHDMEELDNNRAKDLGSRYYDVKKQINDNKINNPGLERITNTYSKETLEQWENAGQKQINNIDISTAIEQIKFEEELLYLEKQITDEQKEQAKLEAEKSESVKIVEKYNKERQGLQEKQNIINAFNSSDELGNEKLKIEDDTIKYWDEKKEDFVEITDFKNAEYARDLLNQQLTLEAEYETEKKHLEDSQKLVVDHSKAILKIWQQDTGLYKKELKDRESATRKYVDSVKAMMAEINQAKSSNSQSTINNNQTTNNRTTNHNYTIIQNKNSGSFSGSSF